MVDVRLEASELIQYFPVARTGQREKSAARSAMTARTWYFTPSAFICCSALDSILKAMTRGITVRPSLASANLTLDKTTRRR